MHNPLVLHSLQHFPQSTHFTQPTPYHTIYSFYTTYTNTHNPHNLHNLHQCAQSTNFPRTNSHNPLIFPTPIRTISSLRTLNAQSSPIPTPSAHQRAKSTTLSTSSTWEVDNQPSLPSTAHVYYNMSATTWSSANPRPLANNTPFPTTFVL